MSTENENLVHPNAPAGRENAIEDKRNAQDENNQQFKQRREVNLHDTKYEHFRVWRIKEYESSTLF